MKNSRTTNSILIMITSGIRQVLTLILTFVSRTIFIYVLGAEYLGLNGLFSNILSVLALSELGIGTAISFYLYKPVANNDIHKIKSLMKFYKICYRIVGVSIIGLGCCLMPILPLLINFEQNISINLYLVYFLYLLNTAASYLFFAYKQAIVTANQEQYKIEKINIIFTFINCIVDIVILLLFKSYIFYLISKILLALLKNIIIALKIDKEYPYLKENDGNRLSKAEIKVFFKDIGAVSLFRIGSTLFNATDNIIISLLLGTVIVGYYSNYYLIISQVAVIISLVINSFTAGIGNVVVKETKEKQFEIFKQLDFSVYIVVTFCTACLFQLLNSFIKIWIGGVSEEYILSQMVVFCLCINFYFDNTTQIMNSFREASGNFETGKTLQLIGGIVNIILSIILGKIFGLVGIFMATIIGKGAVTVSPFLIGISRDVFDKGKYKLLKDYYYKMIIMLIILMVLWLVGWHFHMNGFLNFIVECILSVLVPLLLIYVIFRNKSEMKALKIRVISIVKKVRKSGI